MPSLDSISAALPNPEQFSLLAPDFLVYTFFVGLLGYAAANDIKTFRIPNVIPLCLVLIWPAHLLVQNEPGLIVYGPLVAIAVFVVGLGLFCFRLMGGGDVKLIAAVALWAGPEGVLSFLLVTTVVGGLMAFIWSRQRIRFALAMAADAIGGEGVRNALLSESLPYGVAIASGGAVLGMAFLRHATRPLGL
ncbi:MAG: A24 family peptidase [Magnetovibrionaceae bacterium]